MEALGPGVRLQTTEKWVPEGFEWHLVYKSRGPAGGDVQESGGPWRMW